MKHGEWAEYAERSGHPTMLNIVNAWTEERYGQEAVIEHHRETIIDLQAEVERLKALSPTEKVFYSGKAWSRDLYQRAEKAEADKAKLVFALEEIGELLQSGWMNYSHFKTAQNRVKAVLEQVREKQ